MFDPSLFDLDAYLQRIGCSGALSPDLNTLKTIALRHPVAIPFENLNPFLRRPVALDIASLQQKLVRDGRGGYCFEHNVLLGTALRALGYEVTGLAARVMWNVPPGAGMPRSHMVLRIDLDGRAYVVDAGFGGLTLTGPLFLEVDVEQETPHEPFRLAPDGDGFVMQAQVRSEWKALYRFDLQRQTLPDYEVTNWYLSNHPGSHFVTGLIAARPDADRRYALRNGELSIHYRDGYTERRQLTSAREMRETLEQLFDIRVPEGADVDAAFARLTSAAVPA